jgi:arylsulfate sulfotransferase
MSRIPRTASCLLFCCAQAMIGVWMPLRAEMSISLAPAIQLPLIVGTTTTWTTDVSDTAAGSFWYRFRVREYGGEFRTVRDYGPSNSLDWATVDHEGNYEIEVSARNIETQETASTSVSFEVASLVTGTEAVLSTTPHPLVQLYSAPACEEGSRMRVVYQAAGSAVQATPFKNCRAGRSMNFYLAGMRPTTEYAVKHVVDTGWEFQYGPAYSVTTGVVPADVLPQTVLKPLGKPTAEAVLLASPLSSRAVATDLDGNVVWFNPANDVMITRVEPGGRFIGIRDGGLDRSRAAVIEFDVLGMTLHETNVARVNEQLAAMGKKQIGAFHHEAGRLRGGNFVVLGSVEEILTDVQGAGPVDVLGDMIIVLDEDMQVVWTWDTFDHLDTSRRAVLGQTCRGAGGGCPPIFLSDNANDWTHGNSVQQTPDGNLIYSARHQDWLFKIDYDHGEGNGQVLWRLGKDGDFVYESNDPYPWFSHQHDGGFADGGSSTILVFDNGNTRRSLDPLANSRGQVIQIDEQNRTAKLILNADLGVFSAALGSAEKLKDGDYAFDAGFVFDQESQESYSAISMQVDPSGDIVLAIKAPAMVYRTFRMTDLFSPR